MRKNKYRTIKLFHIILWSLIIIFSLNLLIKCIQIFREEPNQKSTKTKESQILSAAFNSMIQNNLPIMDYISSKEQNNKNSLLLSTMAGAFPINRYVAEATGIDDYLVENDDPQRLTNGSGLLNNNSLFQSLLKQGVENAKKTADRKVYDEQNLEVDIDSNQPNSSNTSNSLNSMMPIDIISGEVYMESEETANMDHLTEETLGSINGEFFTLDQLLNRQFLYNNFYIVSPATTTDDELFDAKAMLEKDMTMKATSDKPQILIYHTHSQEAFADSREGVEEDTVVGLGTHLAEILKNKYGYNVIHDKSKYDIMGGYLDRNLAYNYSCDGVEKILDKNPSIEMIIDVHRDSGAKRVAMINGKNTSKIMLFNGLSRNSKGEISTLKNPYQQDNLAFSLQLQLKGREMYPGLMFKNYLHAYRYNLHLRKKAILAETGTVNNTVEEGMNAMEYLADILYEVLSGDS